MTRMRTRIIWGIAAWAASVFQRIEIRGGPIPDGAVMVVANHQNALIDPLVVSRAAGRPTRPLAKAPLFEQVLLGAVLRSLGGLPVYRKQDDPSQMHRNEDTFRAAIDALLAGDALQIYPEGKSHSQPRIGPLHTGAARIALSAEAERGGRLGLQIQPIGLTWEGKHRFRGRVLAEVGEPFPAAEWLTEAGADDADAVHSLTAEIARALRGVTLNLDDHVDLALITAADRIYTRERGIHRPRERERLADRVPRLRRLAEALEWLRRSDHETYSGLAARVRRVDGVGAALGAQEGSIPRRYPLGSVARYAVKEGLTLLVVLPLAIVGNVVWYPAWMSPRLVLPRVQHEYESVATYKLAVSVFTVPFTIALATATGFLGWGLPGALVAAVSAPLSGFAALAWRERWGRVREDVAVYLRVLTRPRLRTRLSNQRSEIADAFDSIVDRMGAAERGSETAGG